MNSKIQQGLSDEEIEQVLPKLDDLIKWAVRDQRLRSTESSEGQEVERIQACRWPLQSQVRE